MGESIKSSRGMGVRVAGWMFRYHRWFGVFSCLVVIMWAASGVMHPIMSRINPTPVNMQPPQVVPMLHMARSPADVLRQAGIEKVHSFRVMAWNDASYYQVSLPGQNQRRYFEVNSGAELPGGDAKYAEYLARHFMAEQQSELRNVTLIDHFNDDYLDINRLLPVYRVDFDREDGLRAYVETNPPRVSALIDDRKALLGSLFRVMHNWDFMSGQDTLRRVLVSAFLLAAMLSALSGILMYGFMWKRGTLHLRHAPLRRWHRSVGILVSLSALLFVVSAEWHLLGSERRGVLPVMQGLIPVDQLALPEFVRHGMWGKINVMQVEGGALYQLQAMLPNPPRSVEGGEHDHRAATHDIKPAVTYVNADGVVIHEGVKKHAVWLAGQVCGMGSDKVEDIKLISGFAGEYGFLNKRLPVWRVAYETDDHLACYVETSTNSLATMVRDADRAEGWSFSNLHKYHWLDFAGKDVRDFVMGLFCLGNLLIAVLGLWMFTKRYVKTSR
ncbi:MAG: PepSY domain-containing protein [Gallionella sp.]|nr:PepSY domain-containing protein [Gallionella sp.]